MAANTTHRPRPVQQRVDSTMRETSDPPAGEATNSPREQKDSSGKGVMLLTALPLLACCGIHLLVAGAFLVGWAAIGGGAGIAAAVGVGAAVQWWRHRRGARCAAAYSTTKRVR